MSIESGAGRKRLLLHSCCGPCSTAVLERLSPDYQITLFYYNPNITDLEEYNRRKDTQLQVLEAFQSRQRAEQDGPVPQCGQILRSDQISQGDQVPRVGQVSQGGPAAQGDQTRQDGRAESPPPIAFLEGPYEPDRFYQAAAGMEDEPEGGKRCEACFRLRLGKTAETAEKLGFDFFTTTLSVSPHKNAALLNQIGKNLNPNRYLEADFKKKAGYQRSIQMSKELGLYRQSYCGCCFGKAAMERAEKKESAYFSESGVLRAARAGGQPEAVIEGAGEKGDARSPEGKSPRAPAQSK